MQPLSKLTLSILGSLALVATNTLIAQEVVELTVLGVRDTSTVVTEETLVSPSDTAALLRKMPGANINKNGELTGIAQYRGMYGDRVNVNINGSHISSGGPNAMDAPLHYAPVALLKSLTIQRGIAPVSLGQETIGGSVEAVTYTGEFANSSDFELHSRVYVGGQSVNQGNVGNALITLANDRHLFRVGVLKESGNDSDFGEGVILSSEYDRERYDLGYSFFDAQHEFSIDFSRNETGNAGTASLPMDILAVDSDLFRSQYRWLGDDLTITAKVSFSEIEHWMTNFHLRRPPQGNLMMPGPMRHRQAFAVGENSGFSLQAEHTLNNGLLRYGIDGHFAQHDTDITNPNAGAFQVTNFNDIQRNIVGVFLEREMSIAENLFLEAGIRVNQVEMEAGVVGANLNPMNLSAGMPVMLNMMAANLANQFNGQNRDQTDNNVDWFARLNFELNSDLTWYVGLARKNRAPSYQERYLWIPMESTGGLADGFTYIGNVDLDSEVSHEIEFGFDLEGNGFTVYPRVFYKQVDDYIQGTPSTNAGANMFGQMMANMGMGLGAPLQFSNVDATLYGFDVESTFALSPRFDLRATLSSVRGERDDISDNLYRITPDNLILAVDYAGNNWAASIEAQAYNKQEKVSVTNGEVATAGYSVLNAFARFDIKEGLELGLGINNIFDKNYQDHLAGYNRAFNPDIGQRERLPGLGRNLYGRLIWNF